MQRVRYALCFVVAGVAGLACQFVIARYDLSGLDAVGAFAAAILLMSLINMPLSGDFSARRNGTDRKG